MKRNLIGALLLFVNFFVFGQGASVAPTRMYYNNDLGETVSKTLTVINTSDKPQSYQIAFSDFNAHGRDGKIEMLENSDSPHRISPWVSANPSFFSLEPGKKMEVSVTLDTPNLPEAAGVKWGLLVLKQALEKTDPLLDGNQNSMGMQIVNTYQFAIYLFQTPPTEMQLSAVLYEFNEIDTLSTGERQLAIGAENKCKAILKCVSYIEYTNVETGATILSERKQFTLLPEGAKYNKFTLPKDLPSGKYSVMGVFDYGSSTQIEAAELELEIK